MGNCPLLLNRRSILKSCARAGTALLAASFTSSGQLVSAFPLQPLTSRVVIARDPLLRGSGVAPDAERLRRLLDRSMMAFFDRDNPSEAWKQVVRPGQIVGLKVNCLAGLGLSTHVVLTEAVIERLNEAGIRDSDIIIWDRLNKDLERGGFKIKERGKGVRCLGNDSAGYESDLSLFGQAGSLLSRTLTRGCDVVINMPLIKDHGITGMTGALKNVFGAIHNPNKYHPNMGNPYIPDVWMFPAVHQKFQLNICDLLTLQYQGGPSYLPEWTVETNALMISRDPVAMDAVGLDLIDRVRVEQGLERLIETERNPQYLRTAADAEHRIGACDLERISLIEV